MNKLEAVEKKIRELVPRTMEPSFGCHILCGNEVHVLIADKQDGSYIEGILNGKREVWGVNTHHGRIANSEIIGHPITLEDVLEAIHTYSKTNSSCWVAINLKGGFMDYEGGGYEPEENGIQWHFGKPLSEQTELINCSMNFLDYPITNQSENHHNYKF